MPLALSTWVLFIFLMQSVNGTQFMNTNFLFASVSVAAILLNDIFPLTIIYASL